MLKAAIAVSALLKVHSVACLRWTAVATEDGRERKVRSTHVHPILVGSSHYSHLVVLTLRMMEPQSKEVDQYLFHNLPMEGPSTLSGPHVRVGTSLKSA